MKKKVILAILVLFIIVIFLSVIGIQKVSTDKDVYSAGEDIHISWSDFRLYRCTCPANPTMKIYHQTEKGWQEVDYGIGGYGSVCVNGILTDTGMRCDVVYCSFLKQPTREGNVTWNSKIYKEREDRETCGFYYHNQETETPLRSFSLDYAPAGKYKVKFGLAKKVFEIRGSPEEETEDGAINWQSCSLDSDCVCCDGVSIEGKYYRRVCVNKNSVTDCRTLSGLREFCNLNYCKCENNRCISVKKDETANWKTYRNEEHGFKIGYPEDWIATSSKDLPRAYLYPLTHQTDFGADPEIFISIDKEPYTLFLHGTWGIIPYSVADTAQLILSEDITINDIPFKKDYWLLRAGGGNSWLAAISFNTKYNKKYYTISRGIMIESDGLPEAPYSGSEITNEELISGALNRIRSAKKAEFLNQILSTFKFIEK